MMPHARRSDTDHGAVQQQFITALEAVVEEVKRDRSILAAVLCGSLSHDTVWEKSDIDLIFVTIDDRNVASSHVSLYADGLNIHAFLMPRVEFRKIVEGSISNSFMHSLLAKGRLLFTHDETIADLCRRLADMGDRDRQIQLLGAATHALPSIYKAHKWYITRRDLDYTALWILFAAFSLAKIEVIDAGLLADREVIPQALRLNPAFFKTIYSDLLNAKKTPGRVQAALTAIDAYIAGRSAKLFAAVVEYLREVGEARSATEIEAHFKRHFDIEGVTTACEYLADQGLIGKASIAARLTRKSNVDVQELAFFPLGGPADR